MKSRRSERAQKSFRKEISNIIRSMKDPRIRDSFVTVSRVDVSNDLSFGKVFLSSINGKRHTKIICKILNNASGYVQTNLSKNLKTRITPKIIFTPNNSEEYAFEIEKKINILNQNNRSNLFDISRFLEENDNFAIYTHEIPDGDAIGSCSALCLALKQMGKNAKIIYGNEFPSKFEFVNNLINYENENFDPKNFICLDVSDTERIGNCDNQHFHICIDHHDVDSYSAADMVYINKKASACSEILYDLFDIMGTHIDPKIATCIYIGIVSDTGRFKFSNVNSKIFGIINKIFNKIKNISYINFKISDRFSKNFVKFQSEIMKNFEYFGSTCLSVVTLDMLEKYGIDYSELSPIYQIPLTIIGVDLGITIKEYKENLFKISARSLNNGKAFEFCKLFNGGGHSDAAGFEMHGNSKAITNKVIEKILEL